tara:strand:- start:97 stop:954 length:858 start_codon:yes stop_codon:yes gene_type:complete
MKQNHFIYPVSPDSEWSLGNDPSFTYERFEKVVANGEKSIFQLKTGFHQIKHSDYIWVYYTAPDSALKAVGWVSVSPYIHDVWTTESGNDQWAVEITWDKKLSKKLLDSPISLSGMGQNVRGAAVSANSSTEKRIHKWLNGSLTSHEKLMDEEVKFTSSRIRTRQGQPRFRENLLRFYQNRCVVTGCEDTEVLQAAHIKGVRDLGRHAITNGLLLRADVHTLFDLGIITISEDLRVRVDKNRVNDPEYKNLDGKLLKSLTKQKESDLRKIKKSLQYHRKRVEHNK